MTVRHHEAILPLTSHTLVGVALTLLLTATFLWECAEARAVRAGRPPVVPDKDDEVLPPFVAKLFDKTYFAWAITLMEYPENSGHVGDFLVGTFNFTSDDYVAIGIHSPKKMRGPIIICKATSVTDDSASPFCTDYFGPDKPDYQMDLVDLDEDDPEKSHILSAEIIDNKYSLTFAKLIRKFGSEDSLIAWNESARVIFAQGTWEKGKPMPKQHHQDMIDVRMVNFQTGSVEKLKSKLHRTVIYVGIGSVVFVCVCAKVARAMQLKISHLQRRLIAITLTLLFLVHVAMYMFANYQDYKITITRKAFARCVGDGAAWCFSCLLFPVGRRILFSDLLSVSHERAIKYHMLCAILTLILTGIHGVSMWVIYGTPQVVRWRDKDEVSKLPGIIAFCLMFPIIILALLRNRVIHFNIFRYSHYMYMPLMFFACCHYPRLAIGVAPGGSLLLLSFLYKRLINPLDEDETIENIIYDEDSQMVIIDLLKADFVVPGQYYYLGIPEINNFELHPFAVARATIKERTRLLRFVIKNTNSRKKTQQQGQRNTNNNASNNPGGQLPPPPPGGATPPPGAAVTVASENNNSNSKGNKKKQTWTSKVFEMAKEGRMPETYRLDGPYGVLQVNPMCYENICLISGGTGIAPHNCMMQALALGLGPVIGNIDEKKNFMLLWVVPDRSQYNLFQRDLETFAKRLADGPDKTTIIVKVFITHSATNGQVPANARPLPRTRMVKVVEGSRPDFAEELTKFQKNCEENVFTRGDYTSKHTAAMYLSGPQSLMDSAHTAATKLQGLSMHIHKDQQTI